MYIAYPYLSLLIAVCLFSGAFIGLFVASACQVSGAISREEEEERRQG